MGRTFLCFVIVGGLACSTSSASNDGGTNTCAEPTTAISGTIRGLPFSAASSPTKWSPDGKTLDVELESWTEDCAYTKSIAVNGTSVGIEIPRGMLAVGAYQAGQAMFAIDPTDIVIYTGAYPGNDSGITQQFMDGLTGGSVWITSVSDTVVSGAVCFTDPSRQINVSGTFTTTICSSGDAGVSDAASD